MAVKTVFMTNVAAESPLDSSGGTGAQVSNFLTVQTFTNFAVMTGAITAAWHGLRSLTPHAATFWVPYGFSFAWAVVSVVMSLEGLTKNSPNKVGTVLQAIFLAAVNSLVLGGAVVGTSVVTGKSL